MLSLIDHGNEVIYPNPGFPIYESMINYVAVPPSRFRCVKSGISQSILANWNR